MANPLEYIKSLFGYKGPRELPQGDPPRNVDIKAGSNERWRRNLTPANRGQTRWLFRDYEDAINAADSGNLLLAGQLWSALRGDGVIQGQLSTRYDGLLQLPRFIEGGDEKIRERLTAEFDSVFPKAELSLMATDGGGLGIQLGEFVKDAGRLSLRRLDPQYLQYSYPEDRWKYRSSGAGMIDITPGDGRWVLFFPGGAWQPWRTNSMWRALSRAFIAREHATYLRSGWCATMAHPARVATTKKGATEEERAAFLDLLTYWGESTNLVLPDGWEMELLQASRDGYQTFSEAISDAEREIILTINGQTPTAEGAKSFSNTAIHAKIRDSLIQSDAQSLSACLSEQCLWVWVNEVFGPGAIEGTPTVRWDTVPPRDRGAEAQASLQEAQALVAWAQLLQGSGLALDVPTMAERFGIATIPDPNGAKAALQQPAQPTALSLIGRKR